MHKNKFMTLFVSIAHTNLLLIVMEQAKYNEIKMGFYGSNLRRINEIHGTSKIQTEKKTQLIETLKFFTLIEK